MLHSVQYLRAVAATVVVAFHAFINVYGEAVKQDMRFALLAGGVDLFFVISGFIMVTSTTGRSITPMRFVRARCLRIVPLYWLWTAIAVGFSVLVVGQAMPPVREVLLSMAFISYTDVSGGKGPVYNPGWTLNFEMFFYVLFALALLVRDLRARVATIAATMLVLVALRPILGGLGAAAMDWTNLLLLEFAMGAVLGWLYQERRLASVKTQMAIAGFGVTVAVVSFLLFGTHRVPHVGVASAILLAVMVAINDRLPRLGWLVLLGDASYSIYLSHSVTLQVSESIWSMRGSLPGGLFAIAISVVVGVACYRLIEQPMLARFKRRRGEPRAVAA